MPKKEFLLDSNAYLRLAYSLHPLLFDEENLCLYVINEFEDEYKRCQRLQNKFEWVMDEDYSGNRIYEQIEITKDEKKKIKLAFSFIDAQGREYNNSKIDSMAIATVQVKNLTLVTDDGGMVEVAKTVGIHVIGILKLMKILLDSKRITYEQIKSTIAYLMYEKDLPTSNMPKFSQQYKALFNESPPDENYAGE